MIEKLDIRDLAERAGTEFAPGPWHEITQETVDLFAQATRDDQWIHHW